MKNETIKSLEIGSCDYCYEGIATLYCEIQDTYFCSDCEKGRKYMTIKQLAEQLQKRIDGKMLVFCDLNSKSKALTEEIEKLEQQMASIVFELEPVESLVVNQNPQLETKFASLKRVYGKEE